MEERLPPTITASSFDDIREELEVIKTDIATLKYNITNLNANFETLREDTNKYLGYTNCLDSANISPKITRDRHKAIPDIKEDIKDIIDTLQTIKGDIKDAKMIYHQIEFHVPFCKVNKSFNRHKIIFYNIRSSFLE